MKESFASLLWGLRKEGAPRERFLANVSWYIGKKVPPFMEEIVLDSAHGWFRDDHQVFVGKARLLEKVLKAIPES